ncbi:hypothetical protein ACQP3C_31320, partial [Escherichia coli]
THKGKPNAVVYDGNPSTQNIEAGRLEVQGLPYLHSGFKASVNHGGKTRKASLSPPVSTHLYNA